MLFVSGRAIWAISVDQGSATEEDLGINRAHLGGSARYHAPLSCRSSTLWTVLLVSNVRRKLGLWTYPALKQRV